MSTELITDLFSGFIRPSRGRAECGGFQSLQYDRHWFRGKLKEFPFLCSAIMLAEFSLNSNDLNRDKYM